MNVIAAANLCTRYTTGKDRAGLANVGHPFRVMAYIVDNPERILGLNFQQTCMTAVLHDILEDTCCTVDDLRQAEMPEEVIAAVMLLTRSPEQEYEEYLDQVATNKMAGIVKLADICDNIERRGSDIDVEKKERHMDYLVRKLKENKCVSRQDG
jgi:(p)ppGpp synthase/HD superfamily hydrolase